MVVEFSRVLIVGGVFVTLFSRKIGPWVIVSGALLLAASPFIGRL